MRAHTELQWPLYCTARGGGTGRAGNRAIGQAQPKVFLFYACPTTDPTRARKMNVPTVVAGQAKPIRTTARESSACSLDPTTLPCAEHPPLPPTNIVGGVDIEGL